MKTKNFIIVGLVALIIIGVILITTSTAPGNYDGFAKCLSSQGVKMYGAYWCPHCLNQKKDFGNSWKYVNYIECSLPNKAGQMEICKQASIEGYPTWEFSKGERVEGEMSFEQLAGKSGCELA